MLFHLYLFLDLLLLFHIHIIHFHMSMLQYLILFEMFVLSMLLHQCLIQLHLHLYKHNLYHMLKLIYYFQYYLS